MLLNQFECGFSGADGVGYGDPPHKQGILGGSSLNSGYGQEKEYR